MAPPNIESQYKELLCPVKDIEKSFAVNIAELLQDYLSNLLEEKILPNFNSAALLLQGSSSIYGKKVEYLHNLATQLHQYLTKQKKDDQGKKDNVKEKERKRTPKSNEILSLDIKLGKMLSCLAKKNIAKMASGKKPPKKIRNTTMPVHLMPIEEDKKGATLVNIRKETIGNRGDYALSKCKLTSLGWLLLPTVCPSIITAVSNYDDDDDEDSSLLEADNLPENELPNEIPNSSPIDEGLGMEPPNSEATSQPIPESMEIDQLQGPSQSTSSDLGIDVNCSMDINDANPQNPAEDAATSAVDDPAASTSTRHSVRQVLKELDPEENDEAPKQTKKRPSGKMYKENEVRKGRTVVLPRRLKDDYVDSKPDCISNFCARTFFVPQTKLPKKERILWEDVISFQRDSQIYRRIFARIKILRAEGKRVQKRFEESYINVEDTDEVEDVNVGSESGDEGKENELVLNPLQDDDIPIDTAAPAEGDCLDLQPPSPVDDAPPFLSESPVMQVPIDEKLVEIANRHIADCARELQKFISPSDISENVHKWEKTIRPVLNEIEERETFDIDLYGSRILNAFEDSNRKQTITFKEFCKGMPKWQIHRYFLALLPLVNIGNVSIENETSENGTDEQIFITLLSRKMHHKELEEFGHSSGEHP